MQNKVLIVDDDTLLGNILTQALKEEGYEVHYQSSTVGLISAVKEFRPNLMVLDIEIGNQDGINCMNDILQIAPALPILVISSHTESAEVKRALQQGAVAYLKKPFETDELCAYIARHVQHVQPIHRHIGTLVLDSNSKTLNQGNECIKKLTQLEYLLLERLIDNLGTPVTIDEFASIWGENLMNEHTLYNYIRKLRKILQIDPSLSLESAGKGYVLYQR